MRLPINGNTTPNPPVGRRVGRGKMTAGFQNKIDAKKPDSRKNQAFLELLARFELATSSLPTTLEVEITCCDLM